MKSIVLAIALSIFILGSIFATESPPQTLEKEYSIEISNYDFTVVDFDFVVEEVFVVEQTPMPYKYIYFCPVSIVTKNYYRIVPHCFVRYG